MRYIGWGALVIKQFANIYSVYIFCIINRHTKLNIKENKKLVSTEKLKLLLLIRNSLYSIL